MKSDSEMISLCVCVCVAVSCLLAVQPQHQTFPPPIIPITNSSRTPKQGGPHILASQSQGVKKNIPDPFLGSPFAFSLWFQQQRAIPSFSFLPGPEPSKPGVSRPGVCGSRKGGFSPCWELGCVTSNNNRPFYTNSPTPPTRRGGEGPRTPAKQGEITDQLDGNLSFTGMMACWGSLTISDVLPFVLFGNYFHT